MLLKKHKLCREVRLHYNDLHKIYMRLHNSENFYFSVSYCLNFKTELTIEVTHFIFYCRASTWIFKCFGSWRSFQFLWILRSCSSCLTIISFRPFDILHFLRLFLYRITSLYPRCRWSLGHTFFSQTNSLHCYFVIDFCYVSIWLRSLYSLHSTTLPLFW
jgi:hypothetical protein